MELTIFMAGWSSRNKYSLLGAMRAIAQMISYEVPLILSSVTVIMAAGSLSTVAIVERQAGYSGILPHWFVFTPWGFAGFVLFMIAATAESNRSPFDLPEGESEIIAGYYTEYSGFKFALFFLGEYIGMFAISGLGITLFLGGWAAPFSFLTWVPSYLWFFAKLLALIAMFIWVRGTLPRLRMDQLMNFAWKFMLPMALLNLVTAGVWHFLPQGVLRWLVCSRSGCCSVCFAGPRIDARLEAWRSGFIDLPNRRASRMNRLSTKGSCLLFTIFAMLTVAGAVAAMSLRNLVHCVLALTWHLLAWRGVSATRRAVHRACTDSGLRRSGGDTDRLRGSAYAGYGDDFAIYRCAAPGSEAAWLSLAVFGVLAWAIHHSAASRSAALPQPEASMKQIGNALMLRFALPLEVIGLLLTVALIGAVTIAMREKQETR